MIRNFQPHQKVDFSKPIFQQEWRRLGGLHAAGTQRLYKWFMLIGVPLVIGAWWWLELPHNRYTRLRQLEYAPTMLIYLNGFVMLVSSIYVVIASVSYFHQQRQSEQWRLLALTDQSADSIVDSYHKIAQARLWWLVVLEASLRSALVFTIVISGFYSLHSEARDKLDFVFRFLLLSPFFLLGYAILMLPGIAFCYEPAMRLRNTTAICLRAAMEQRDLYGAIFLSFGRQFFVYLIQIVVFSYAAYLLLNADRIGNDEDDMIFLICFAPQWLGGMALLMALYLSHCRHALRKAAAKIALPE